MRVTFNLANLQAAGPQRVLADMVNYWAEKGWELTVITYDDYSECPFFSIHPSVELVRTGTASPYAGLVSALAKNLRSTVRLRREIIRSSPDCVIAFSETNGVRALLASMGTGIPVVVSEHANPHYFISTKNAWIWNLLRSCVYPWAAAIIVLTERNKQYFRKALRAKIVVIPNAVPTTVDATDEPPSGVERLPPRTIAAMGRLSSEKGFDLLLKAFSVVLEKIDCNLAIVGDGPLRKELEELAKSLGVFERVIMTGFLKDPWPLLKHADMFVLSSRSEAFPMVILEAMAHGLPVVSFDCPMGPAEIIRDRVDGLLIPPLDVEGLARAMVRLLENPEERTRFALQAIQVRERYDLARIMESWERVLASVCDISKDKPTNDTPDR